MLDQLGNGLLLGIIISVASVALSLLYGVTRIVNFAHGEIIALGAIATLFFSSPIDYRVLFLDKFSPLGLYPFSSPMNWPDVPSIIVPSSNLTHAWSTPPSSPVG